MEKLYIYTCKRLVHIAISPHVTSAPNTLQTLLKGRFPTVVKGARYNLSLKSISIFSRGCNFRLRSVSGTITSVSPSGSACMQSFSTVSSVTHEPIGNSKRLSCSRFASLRILIRPSYLLFREIDKADHTMTCIFCPIKTRIFFSFSSLWRAK